MNKLAPYILTFCIWIPSLESVQAADDFPFAPGTLDAQGGLVSWSWANVRDHRDKTIGDLDGLTTVPQKDNAADPSRLGYLSHKVETKTFETELDLSDVEGHFQMAIQVDDGATLKIEELSSEGGLQSGGISKTYQVNGTALWNWRNSYKEFTDYMPAGRKYKLRLAYQNTANITARHPSGYVDYDGVNVYVVHTPDMKLDIVSVPEYLYARATYATPVKFTIGDIDEATIVSLEVEFDDGASTYKYPTNTRFVADDGPEKNNGTSSTYTCFVPSDFYATVGSHVPNTFTSDAKFRINVVYLASVAGEPAKAYTRQSDWKGVSGYYADPTMPYVVDIGAGEKSMTVSPEVEKDGEFCYEVLEVDHDVLKPGDKLAPNSDVPGFDRFLDLDTFCKNLANETSFGAHVKLYDDRDLLESTGNGNKFKARGYGMRRGALVFVSYQGRPMGSGVLDEGELAMDLSRNQTDLDCTLFDMGTYSVLVKSENGNALSLSAGFVSAGTGITACFLAAPPWGAALGTAAIVIDLVANYDADSINCAEVDIRQVKHLVRNDGSVPGLGVTHLFHSSAKEQSITDATSVALHGESMTVGDQLVLYLEVNVSCTAEAYPSSESLSEALGKWQCNNAQDFGFVRVNARP